MERFGPNRLPEQPPPSLGWIFLRQFSDPLIYVLLAAAAVSIAVGDVKDAGFIFAVLMINAAIGTWQENRAEQSSHALRRLLQIRASVWRDGEVVEIPADQVVPGDLVRLESGNRVPADLRIVEASGLEIDESLLTGESVAVTKDADWTGSEDAPLGDRLNTAHAGTVVTRGRATGIVVETGVATQIGRLAHDITAADAGKPPLVARMEKFSKTIAVATLVVAAAIGGLGYAVGRFSGWADMFMFVVALAVSAIPEGLPVAMTVALAIGTSRMAKRRMIVRKLVAVEGLGSATLIATDKTGTLTANQLTVREILLADRTTFAATGTGFAPEGEIRSGGSTGKRVTVGEVGGLDAILRAGVFCNEGDLHRHEGEWVARGDAVDLALLSLGLKGGVERGSLIDGQPECGQIPFESERQYAATFHENGGEVCVYAKGAPERVLALCDLSDVERQRFEGEAIRLAGEGYRVLALAEGLSSRDLACREEVEPTGLSFLGYVAMIDPLRPGVREAVAVCREAGVKVAMVTGDHRVTAIAIAKDLGLGEGDDEPRAVTGQELLELDEAGRAEAVREARVFARVAPRQKLEIVEAARRAGEFVVVTGDGANDAPALRAANIGVAMGQAGTDVAREAAELVLADDNFATIVAGIEEGRVAYDNIRKVVFLLVSTGAAELLMVLLAVVTGYPLPLLPVQLLWLNLVTNGIQGVALAFEPSEGDVLQRRPRPPGEPIFNRLMVERNLVAIAVMGGVSFGAFAWMVPEGATAEQVASARNLVLLLMVLFENFHIGNCRSETKSAFALSPFRSPLLLAGAAGAFGLHVIAMHLPFMQSVLGVRPVSPATWLVVIALAFTIVPAIELHKMTWRLRYGDGRSEKRGAERRESRGGRFE